MTLEYRCSNCGILLQTTNADQLHIEMERLRAIEVAARALRFSGYPAHGSGFVITVTGGDINDLAKALKQDRVGEYIADYSQVDPKDLEDDQELKELYDNSTPVDQQFPKMEG